MMMTMMYIMAGSLEPIKKFRLMNVQINQERNTQGEHKVMKLTKAKLKQIIKEELNRLLSEEVVSNDELERMRDEFGSSRYSQGLFTELRNLIGEMEQYPEGSPERERAKLGVASFMYENELHKQFRQIFGQDLNDYVAQNRSKMDLSHLDDVY